MEGTKPTTGEGHRSAPSSRFPLVSGDNRQKAGVCLIRASSPLCSHSQAVPALGICPARTRKSHLYSSLSSTRERGQEPTWEWELQLVRRAAIHSRLGTALLATVAKAAAWREGEGRAWMKLTWSLLLPNSDSKAWGEEGAF